MKSRNTIAALLLLVLSCAKRETAAVRATHGGDSPSQSAVSSERADSPAGPYIVRNARVTVIAADVQNASAQLGAAAESLGGYLANSRQWRDNEQTRASLGFRVPSDRLGRFLAAIRKSGRVDQETITGDDVTAEYVDLRARVTNLEATETELRALLATVRQRTQKASEILAVHTELARIRGEIEQAKGRIRYLEQATSLSTVEVELIPDALMKPITPAGWQPLAIARRAASALVSTLQFFATIAIWLGVYVAPLALLLGALVMATIPIRRRLRRAD